MGHMRIFATAMAILATTGSVYAEEQVRSSQPTAAEQAQASGKFVRCTGHERRVTAVVFTPDGKSAISGGEDPYLIVWNTVDGKEASRIPLGASVNDLALSSDGKQVAALKRDRRIHFWDIATGKRSQKSYPLEEPAIHWALSPDQSKLAASAFTDIRIWDLKQGNVIRKIEFDSEEIGVVYRVAFSPDGKYLAGALSGSGRFSLAPPAKVQVWESSSGKEIFNAWSRASQATDVAFSPDGTLLAAVGDSLEVWDLATSKSLYNVRPPNFSANCLAFSPDGKKVATAGHDGTIRLWEAATGKLLSTLQGHSDAVYGLSFSSDGTKLASAGDKLVLIWSLTP